MKNLILALAILPLLLCGPAQADNNIMIMVDTIRSAIYDIPIAYENDVELWGFSNGYRISVSGDNIAWFVYGGASIDTVSRGGMLPSVWWAFRYVGYDTLFADTILTGTPYL